MTWNIKIYGTKIQFLNSANTWIQLKKNSSEWESFIQNSLQILIQTQFQEQKLQIYQNKRISELEQKISKHQCVCKYESITDRETLEKQEKKIQKKKNEEFKKQQQIRDKLWYTERDEIHQQDLKTRRCEQEWKKEVKTLQKAKQPISPELEIPIPDPEAVWKAGQEELKKQFPLQLYEQDEKEEGIEIIVDTAGDKSLQQDYIALLESSEEDLSNF